MATDPYLLRDAHGVTFTVFHGGRDALWLPARGRWVAYAPISPAAHVHHGWPIDAALAHFLVQGGITVVCYRVGATVASPAPHLAYANPAHAVGLTIPLGEGTLHIPMAATAVQSKRGRYYHLPDQFWQYAEACEMPTATGEAIDVPASLIPERGTWMAPSDLAICNPNGWTPPDERREERKCDSCGAALTTDACLRCVPAQTSLF